MDTLGQLLVLHVAPADEQDRAQAGDLARQVQPITEEMWSWPMWIRGYTGQAAEDAAAEHGIRWPKTRRSACSTKTINRFSFCADPTPRYLVVERNRNL
jgi:hypothetical protein